MSNPTLDAAWGYYAERSGLTIEGVACSPGKAQTAYFAFEAGWNRRSQPEGMSIALREVTDKLSDAAAENLSLGMENRQLREQLESRAQPEGEAPQADLTRRQKENAEFSEWWASSGQQSTHDLITENAAHATWQERARRVDTLSPLCGSQHAESGKEGVIDYSIDKGDTVYHRTWRLTPLEVVDVNWALRAIALQLGSDGCVVVWPAAGLSKTPYDDRAAQLDGGQEGSESNG